ncbi:hypothetical protein [Luteolibacter soli]|uniref:Carbohydrate-binding family V/XII n=1 Tax=Luteolibacter soli TaxID=3135280 RepID=A0ABU9APD4_9BACT
MKINSFSCKSRLLPCLGVLAMALPGLVRGIEPTTSAPPIPPADQSWPRDIVSGKVKITCYQPQIDEWTGYRVLHARFAVALTPPGEAPQLGVAEVTGETTSDPETRTVVIRNIKIEDARFQTEKPEDATRLEALLKQSFPSTPVTASLDHMLAGVKLAKGAAHTADVKMEPPPIFISTEPAMLLMVEGKPVLAPIDKSELKFVVNTNWDILFDEPVGNYYLLSGDVWMTAKDIAGPWEMATSLPLSIEQLPDDETWQHVKQALPWTPRKGMVIPKVKYSDKPAELITFSGDPVWEKVEGTTLSFANNTESDVFQAADGTIYFLVSGRWFKTAKLGGEWAYAGNDLPEDFKQIPEDGPEGDVLASVPGTDEAEDAVLLASVPTEAVVNIKQAEAKAAVSYNGEPTFKPIENTQMTYATNTPADVVQCEGKYYLCQDAVWFVSTAPNGPWKVCKDVPEAIYSIPPSSPVYRVTYVNVEDEDGDDGEVTCSYTAGYFGAFVAGLALGDCLVWGTGYYYPPYVGWWGHYPAYYPYHYSYGCAAAYNRWTGGYAVGERVYGPYASAGRAAWYNPATGRYGRAAHVEGPYGGRTVAGAYNPRTGTGWATRQGNNGYAQWGTSVARRGDHWVQSAHIAGPDGGAAAWRGSNGAGTFHWSDEGHGGMAVHNGDFYAGHDGNVYRKDGGDWSKWSNGGWEPVGHKADGFNPGPKPGPRPDPTPGPGPGPGPRPDPKPGPGPGPQPHPDGFIPGETRHVPDSGRNGFITGQTKHNFPGYPPGGNRPGADGGGQQFQPGTRPGAGGGGQQFQPPTRPGEGGGGEQFHPQPRPGADGGGIQRQDLPQRHVTDPGEVQQRLNREANTRDLGDQRERQQQFQRSSGGGGLFQRGGGGGFQGGGGGGFSRGGGGGGFSRGGGGFHRR